MADSHVCCCATGTASSVSLAKSDFDDVARWRAGKSRPNTQSYPRATIVSPRFSSLRPKRQRCHLGRLGHLGLGRGSPSGCFVASVAVLPKASNAQAGPTTSDSEGASIPAFLQRDRPASFEHGTQRLRISSHLVPDRGSSPSSGLNLTFIAAASTDPEIAIAISFSL